jgi:hypothetical protein
MRDFVVCFRKFPEYNIGLLPLVHVLAIWSIVSIILGLTGSTSSVAKLFVTQSAVPIEVVYPRAEYYNTYSRILQNIEERDTGR